MSTAPSVRTPAEELWLLAAEIVRLNPRTVAATCERQARLAQLQDGKAAARFVAAAEKDAEMASAFADFVADIRKRNLFK